MGSLTLSDLTRAENPNLGTLGVGERAPKRPPAAETVRGVVGGRRLDRVPPGVLARRMGLSGRCNDDRPFGVFGYSLLTGDSDRLREGVIADGERAVAPTGELSVGVGGGCDESTEFRLLALFKGTNIPDIGCAVVK